MDVVDDNSMTKFGMIHGIGLVLKKRTLYQNKSIYYRQKTNIGGKVMFLHLSVSQQRRGCNFTSYLPDWSHVLSRGCGASGCGERGMVKMGVVKEGLW